MPLTEAISTERNRQRDALEAHITRLNDREVAFRVQLDRLPETYPQIPGDKLSGMSTQPERNVIRKGLEEITKQKAEIPGLQTLMSQPVQTGGPIDQLQAQVDSLKKDMAEMVSLKPKESNGNAGVVPVASKAQGGEVKSGQK